MGREASNVRFGLVYQFAITPIVDLYLVGSLPVVSPDGLSAWNDLYGTASIRYRWASGDRDRPTIRGIVTHELPGTNPTAAAGDQ